MSAGRRAADHVLPPTPANIERAAAHLRGGGLVAFPTETVYGLGADAANAAAVARIFEIKGRPRFNPLIVHVADRAVAAKCGDVGGDAGGDLDGPTGSAAAALAAAFWPGPLTLVVRRRAAAPVAALACAGLDTVALRQPAHPVARDLLIAAGRPIAAPSANRSGRLSPTEAAHFDLPPPPAGPLILDGGRCPLGLESTIVDCTGERPTILRHGAITAEELAAAIGDAAAVAALSAPAAPADAARPQAPGQLARHYAPATPLRLAARDVAADEALLAFGPDVPPGAAASENLSRAGDLTEAAANLFAMLHRLDAARCRAIAVMPVPDRGLGRAINDRLRRAAGTADQAALLD